MKTIYIILMFAAAFLALFEQSKARPNVIVMVVAMAVFMIGLMRLMAKVPGKNQQQGTEHDDEDIDADENI